MDSTKPEETQDDVIATPEGDGEMGFDQPIVPLDVDVTRPRGNEPHPGQPVRDALE